MTTVLLFDVDGTLVSTGGAGRLAMAQAFEEVCGSAEALDDIDFGGMTDRSILRIGVERLGRRFDEDTFNAIVAVYVARLGATVAESTGYVVMPNVEETLEACAAEGAWMGLGTGNVRRGAQIKLEPAGLHRHFEFGGFGDDAEDRAELIGTAARRGAAKAGRALEECRVVIIGDTPRDIDAAHAIGATCLGVATGGYDADALAAADRVVETLADPRALSFLLRGE